MTEFVHGDLFVEGVQVTYTCDENYGMSGPSVITCDSNRNWTALGTCVPGY